MGRYEEIGGAYGMESRSERGAVPIYVRLVEAYRRDILLERVRAGDRIDSITEIQRKHKVARDTAKRVLSILEGEGYIVQRAGKGSFVSDLRPKLKVWGAIVPFYSVQYDDLVVRLSREAQRVGRELRYFYDHNDWREEIRLVNMMLGERYEAMIVIPTLDESRTWAYYSQLSPRQARVVLFDHTMSYHDFTFVIQSYDLGVVRAIDYLLGRRTGGAAFIRHEGWAGRNMVLELMFETYWMAMLKRKPDFEPVVVERASAVEAEDLRRRGVTGILCCDDISAVQAIGRLKGQGVAIPEEMCVVSYGNTDLARFFTPPITSIDPHNGEMVSRLVELLMERAEQSVVEQRQCVVQPELVVRGT